MEDLRKELCDHGAVLSALGRPLHFGNAAAELQAAGEACVVAERSDLGRLLGTGPDLLSLLQRLSTGDVAALQPGQGRPTVLTTNKGRIVSRVWVHHLGDRGVLLLGGPGCASRVQAHLDRFTFAEKTGLTDTTTHDALFAISGPRSPDALRAAGIEPPQPFHSTHGAFDEHEIDVLGQDGTSGEGFSILCGLPAATGVWESLVDAAWQVGGRPTGDQVLEAYRVQRGIPAAGHELTEDHNPLEAGLWDSVSFEKGCYVGQEVVARLRTYDKISRALVRLELSDFEEVPRLPCALLLGDRSVGTLTSVATLPGTDRSVGLGYLKKRAIEPEMELGVDAQPGKIRLVEVLQKP